MSMPAIVMMIVAIAALCPDLSAQDDEISQGA